MLTNLEVFCSGITAPPLPIVDQIASLDPIQIKNIDGLGPVKADVSTDRYGSIDGAYVSGTSTPERNIVITVVLNPKWASQSIESLRTILYSYFMPENTVRLRFSSTHMPTVEISGVVESCEPNHFAKDPEYQISIICPQPYFLAVDLTSISGTTAALAATGTTTVNYQGNVDTGVILDVTNPSGAAFNGEVRLVSKTPNTLLLIVAGALIDSTRSLRISSVQGDKYVRQVPIPASVNIDVMQKVAVGSTWIRLRRSSANNIQVLASTTGLPWTLSYYAKYGGL